MKAYANMYVHLVLCNNKFAFIAFVPLEVVLFDVDGTLYDSDPIHFVVLRELLQELDDDIAIVLFPDDIERGLDYVKKKKNVLGSKPF
ncbi:putative phosphoglycolate phosphatase-like, domain 2, HAD superfamily [Helianthus debilis subsp. tardiflorus]